MRRHHSEAPGGCQLSQSGGRGDVLSAEERQRLYVDEAAPPLEGPAEPLADATPHDPREVVTL